MVLGVFVPIVTSLSNSWQIAVTEDLEFSRTAYSISGTITQAVGIFLGPVASYYLTKYNHKKLWRAFAILFSAGVFVFSLAQNQYHFYISAFVVGVCFIENTSIPIMMINNWFYEKRGIGLAMVTVIPPLVTSSIYNRERYGEAYGFLQSGMQIAAAIGPLFVSFIFYRLASYYIAWILNIVLAILTGVLWYIAHQRAKKYENQSVK